MSVRFKRLIAFIIDWYITLFPFAFIFLLTTFLWKRSLQNPFIVFFCFLAIIFAFGAFTLRDVIFKGRSLGKRIFGLYIYDKNSLGKANARQRCLRNIFFFLYFFDGILLLVTGQTIGDRVAGTLVTSKQGFESYTNEIQDGVSAPKQKKVKKVVLVIVIIIACLAIFVGLIQIVLNTQKDTEEYQVAYRYFI